MFGNRKLKRRIDYLEKVLEKYKLATQVIVEQYNIWLKMDAEKKKQG